MATDSTLATQYADKLAELASQSHTLASGRWRFMRSDPIWSSGRNREECQERRRDLCLLPIVFWDDSRGAQRREVALCEVANFAVAAINHLHVGMTDAPLPSGARSTARSAAQTKSHEHVMDRVGRFCARLASVSNDLIGLGDFSHFESSTKVAVVSLDPAAIDLPRIAGRCNPEKLVPQTLWQAATVPTKAFSSVAG